MNLWVENLIQNFESVHTSVENFENPGHPPSSRTDENVRKIGRVFQENRRLTIMDICNIWDIMNSIFWRN